MIRLSACSPRVPSPEPTPEKSLVIPLRDPLVTIDALGETHPGIPQLARGHFLLPVTNVGEIDLLHVHATVQAGERTARAEVHGLAPGEVQVLILGRWDELPSFELRLEATAADGSEAITCARFDAVLDHYL